MANLLQENCSGRPTRPGALPRPSKLLVLMIELKMNHAMATESSYAAVYGYIPLRAGLGGTYLLGLLIA